MRITLRSGLSVSLEEAQEICKKLKGAQKYPPGTTLISTITKDRYLVVNKTPQFKGKKSAYLLLGLRTYKLFWSAARVVNSPSHYHLFGEAR